MQPLPAFLIIAVLSIVTSGQVGVGSIGNGNDGRQILPIGETPTPGLGPGPRVGVTFGGNNHNILPIEELDPSECGQYECSRRKWKWGTGEMIPVCCDLVDGKCPKRTRENLMRCRELEGPG